VGGHPELVSEPPEPAEHRERGEQKRRSHDKRLARIRIGVRIAECVA
jgi:hypothetical protein